VRIFLYLLVFIFISSCNNSEKKFTKDKEAMVYDMYKPSEMSILMNDMYAYNLKIKQAILEGETPTEFPSNFLNIYTAELSEFKSRNEVFQGFSTLFIETQKEVFNPKATLSITERYNNGINLCISCHSKECTGPIPKIKKLLIK
jgi:hypothetical protein